MKVLELNFERTWRGGERQTLYNMQGFRNAEQDVTLICRKGFPLEARSREEQFTTHSFNNIFGVLWFLMTKGHRYDVLHAQSSHILTYCLITKPFHRRKIIFTRRVDFVPKGAMTRLKYRLTDKLIAISTAVKKIVSDFSGRNDVDVISDIVVPKTLDKQRVFAEFKKAGIHCEGKHIIGTTAAIVPHKDPLTMVNAIRELKQIRNDFIFLHFGTGDLETQIQEKIHAFNLADAYKLMGFYENVEDFFTVFECFVMSSEEEGLGSSVLDAFVYKVPVVSTEAGGLKDLINAERAIACNNKDYKGLAAGINHVLDNRPQEMLDNAYNYVINNHSSVIITQQYLKIM